MIQPFKTHTHPRKDTHSNPRIILTPRPHEHHATIPTLKVEAESPLRPRTNSHNKLEAKLLLQRISLRRPLLTTNTIHILSLLLCRLKTIRRSGFLTIRNPINRPTIRITPNTIILHLSNRKPTNSPSTTRRIRILHIFCRARYIRRNTTNTRSFTGKTRRKTRHLPTSRLTTPITSLRHTQNGTLFAIRLTLGASPVRGASAQPARPSTQSKQAASHRPAKVTNPQRRTRIVPARASKRQRLTHCKPPRRGGKGGGG